MHTTVWVRKPGPEGSPEETDVILKPLHLGALIQLDYSTALARAAPLALEALPPRAGADPYMVYYTSGTTGTPKAVVLTHAVRRGSRGWRPVGRARGAGLGDEACSCATVFHTTYHCPRCLRPRAPRSPRSQIVCAHARGTMAEMRLGCTDIWLHVAPMCARTGMYVYWSPS